MYVDPLKEMEAKYHEQKARASELSRDYDHSRREIKVWQDKAAAVEGLEEKVASLEAELIAAQKNVANLAKASADASVSTSQAQKRADAFVAIRDALATK